MSRHIAIVGAGVVGLTTALCLLEHGHRVTIFARERTPRTTSDVAAAFWLPYKVETSPRVFQWAAETRDWYVSLAAVSATGVRLAELRLRGDDSAHWQDFTRNFGAVENSGWLSMTVPRIETPVFMGWLEQAVRAHGAAFVDISLADLDEAPAGDIINCTGLGARELVKDESVLPVQGQVVRVTRPMALSILVDETGAAPTYVVPRDHDCILGGTAVENAWQTTPDPEVTKAIVERCCRLCPELRESRILSAQVGLRPGRARLRLESELLASGQRVIHNYGHGGAGFTTAWGTAKAILNLL